MCLQCNFIFMSVFLFVGFLVVSYVCSSCVSCNWSYGLIVVLCVFVLFVIVVAFLCVFVFVFVYYYYHYYYVFLICCRVVIVFGLLICYFFICVSLFKFRLCVCCWHVYRYVCYVYVVFYFILLVYCLFVFFCVVF